MKRKLESFLAALLGLVVLISAAVVISNHNSAPWNLKKYYSQKLKWSNCYQRFECASFKVPIDYENLKLGQFKLQVLKRAATDPKSRFGSLVVNPGGPGGSGIDYAFSANTIVSKDLGAKFDIIGFDGRGIGESEPLRCLTDKEADKFIDIDGDASSPQQISILKSAAKSFADSCAKKAGVKLGHLSTFETAKDMDILRSVLGENKLNYLGKSYGTYLGAIYISLYPQKVGRFVLDGAIDPNIPIREQNLNQAAAFEKSLDEYLKTYNQFSKSDIQKFIDIANTNPIKNKNGRKLTRSLVVTAIAASLYDNVLGWKRLSLALNEAITNGKPDRLFRIADDYNNRDYSGHYYNNQNDIGIAINCIDWNSRSTFEEIAEFAPNFVKASETFGRFIAYSELTCSYWKAPPIQPKLPFKDIKSTPFIIVGVTKDPATPYVWSVNLAKSFPDSVLLTLDGEGHTGHNRGNSCIDSRVDRYFLRGELPSAGISCVARGN